MTGPILRPQLPSKQHGQTLAEFAISLPLVLLLLFGILEFGRMFQSWVTLQNAARSAVRYAITGQYNEERYDLEFLVPCYQKDQMMEIIDFPVTRYNAATKGTKVETVKTFRPTNVNERAPAVTVVTISSSDDTTLLRDPNNSLAPRRVSQRYTTSTGDIIIEKWASLSPQTLSDLKAAGNSTLEIVALNPDESLYATWYGYDGKTDCTPTPETDQNRKDIVRMASIYDEARRGAAGLALDESLTGKGTLPEFERFIRNFWANPSPSQEADGWFNVMICSARGRMYPIEETVVIDNPDDPNSMTDASGNPLGQIERATVRFHNFRGPGVAAKGRTDAYVGGACLLKEYPNNTNIANSTMIENHNEPWADAGGAGERVVIIITYNHPLITPLGLARFVRMQASRSAVNEAFKIVSAERAIGTTGAGIPPFTATEDPGPSATEEPAETEEPMETPEITPEATEPPAPPFDCAKLQATDVSFSGQNTIYVRMKNDNVDDTTYLYARMVWNSARMTSAANSPNAYAGFVSVQNEANWSGYQSKANKATFAAPVNTNSRVQGDSFLDDDPANSQDVYIIGLNTFVPAEGSARWQLTFLGLQQPLYKIMDLWELGGTKIAFQNPTTGGECVIALDVPPGPPLPTETPFNFVPTPTFTPDCADARMKVTLGSFMFNGDVSLDVTNFNKATPGYLVGFVIQWQKVLEKIPNMKLVRVVVGGRHANDFPSPQNANGTGVIVWENLNGGDTNSTTNSTVTTDGRWVQNFTFPPDRTIPVYLDFVGEEGMLDSRGVGRDAFNGSILRISCNPNGGPGQGGTGANYDGDITFDENTPPPPTGNPPPTITPAPTQPPTNTPTKGPSKTPVPTQPSRTPAPSTNTPRPSNTPPPPPTLTPDISGCRDSC